MPNRPAARQEVAGPTRARRAVVQTTIVMTEAKDHLAPREIMDLHIIVLRNVTTHIMVLLITDLSIIVTLPRIMVLHDMNRAPVIRIVDMVQDVRTRAIHVVAPPTNVLQIGIAE